MDCREGTGSNINSLQRRLTEQLYQREGGASTDKAACIFWWEDGGGCSSSSPHTTIYVREDRQGPSWARNCGITIAKAEILAFTDDDVVVDSHWLAEMVKSFRGDGDVVCAAGLVLPMELDTPTQLLFEEVGGYNKGFEPRVFSL